MALQLVPEPDYSGVHGVAQVRALQQDLTAALRARDWTRLRRLDQRCAMVVDRAIAANDINSASLLVALKDLKKIYATLIESCQQEAAAMAI